MPGKFLMKALKAGTHNLTDGTILHLDPEHQTDARARYPRVPTQKDVDRLVREEVAQPHTGRAPFFKGFAYQVEQPPVRTAGSSAPKAGGSTRGGPRQETDDEALRTAGQIEGEDDDDDGAADPTRAPAS